MLRDASRWVFNQTSRARAGLVVVLFGSALALGSMGFGVLTSVDGVGMSSAAGAVNLAPNAGPGGMPSHTIEYGADVEVWWAGHPFNPESSGYVPVGQLPSPEPVVNVRRQHGGDVQAAINRLPATGGTLLLEPGTYGTFEIIGRNNVHIVSPGGAIIRGAGSNQILGCELARDYSAFNRAVAKDEAGSVACATGERVRNVYFKNIEFDGANASLVAVNIRAATDVVFDRVTFRNFRDPADFHRGLVSGSAMIENIWVRGSRFAGKERYALYLDGAHSSGVLESDIDYSFGSGGLLFLANDDFSQDYNRNGRWDPDELRIANYIVVARNRFGADGSQANLHTAVSVTGANALIAHNQTHRRLELLAEFPVRCSQRWPNLSYEHFGHRVIGNDVQETAILADFDARLVSCRENTARLGRYSVRDNVVRRQDQLNQVVRERGVVEGPNSVSLPEFAFSQSGS